jgi:hypothetical protein
MPDAIEESRYEMSFAMNLPRQQFEILRYSSIGMNLEFAGGKVLGAGDSPS